MMKNHILNLEEVNQFQNPLVLCDTKVPSMEVFLAGIGDEKKD